MHLCGLLENQASCGLPHLILASPPSHHLTCGLQACGSDAEIDLMHIAWESWAVDPISRGYCGLDKRYAKLMWQNPKQPRFASVYWRTTRDPGAVVKMSYGERCSKCARS